MPNSIYNEQFYRNQAGGSLKSADVIVPLINSLIKPKSVIDIGCGVGTWLSVFEKYNVNVCGFDGDYVKRDTLLINKENFCAKDLSREISCKDRYDLAISVEVAEHLPQERSASFVKELTQLAPVVVFSAAIPFQGGENHINEQWQNYWVELFRQSDYYAFDCIRPQVWENNLVDWWYRNNMLIFCSRAEIENHPVLTKWPNNLADDMSFNLVHPVVYLNKQKALLEYKRKFTQAVVLSGTALLFALLMKLI